MDNFGSKLRKTAEEMAGRLNDAAQSASEKLGEMRELSRLNGEIRSLKREKDQCKTVMADLLIRMFDQNTFAEALLRPEYDRIREVDQAIAALEVERAQVAAHAGVAPTETAEMPQAAATPEETPAPATTVDEDELPADTTTL